MKLIIFVQFLAIFLASITSISFTYFKIPVNHYQQVVAIFIPILLFIFNYLTGQKRGSFFLPFDILIVLTLFISSIVVQLLVLSSGGIFSPFLILFHLFALGSSFLINLRVSLGFILFSLTVLVAHSLFDTNQLLLVKNDPGTVLLYLVSFVVIIPLAYLISKKYHLKDQISKVLTKQISIDKSILESLNDLVLITDNNLLILSANDAVLSLLGTPKDEIEGKLLFNVMNLQTVEGIPADLQTLPVKEVISQNLTRTVSDLYIQPKNKPTPIKVAVKIRPYTNDSNQVDQLAFIISESLAANSSNHSFHETLEQAMILQTKRFQQLKQELQGSPLKNQALFTEILSYAENDIILSNQLEDHPIKSQNTLVDLAYIIKKAADAKIPLAKGLNIDLNFNLPSDEIKEFSIINLYESGQTQSQTIPISDYSLTADPKWLSYLIQKLIDLALLTTTSNKLTVNINRNTKGFELSITSFTSVLTETNIENLYKPYYGDIFNQTNLKLGSGLEGFIAKQILNQLNINLDTNIEHSPPSVIWKVQLLKTKIA